MATIGSVSGVADESIAACSGVQAANISEIMGQTLEQYLAITGSVLFQSSSKYMYRTFGSANRDKWTFEFCFKRTATSSDHVVFSRYNSPSSYFGFGPSANDLRCYYTGGDRTSTTSTFGTSVWSHAMCVWDNSLSSPYKLKYYINGSLDSDAESFTEQVGIGGADIHTIGGYGGGGNPFNFQLQAYLANIRFIDNAALSPSDLMAVTGSSFRLKAYEGAWGTNGFWLDFSNSAALGTDASGNGNNWTLNNISSSDFSSVQKPY